MKATRAIAGAALAAVACGGSQLSETAKHESHDEPLTDVQAQCRSDHVSFIGTASDVLGPTCQRSTMPLALQFFDLGTLGGEFLAQRHAMEFTWLCICADTRCTDEVQARAMRDAVKNIDPKPAISRGTVDIMDRLESHACLRADVAVMLYQEAFWCGWLAGLKSERVRRQLERDYLAGFLAARPGEDAQARELAAQCFAKL